MKKYMLLILSLFAGHATLYTASQAPTRLLTVQSGTLEDDWISVDYEGGREGKEKIMEDRDEKAQTRFTTPHHAPSPSRLESEIHSPIIARPIPTPVITAPLEPLLKFFMLSQPARINELRSRAFAEKDSWTPAHHAAFVGNEEFFEQPLQGKDLLALTPSGYSPLHLALMQEHPQTIAPQIVHQIKGSAFELPALTQPSGFFGFPALHLALMLSDDLVLIRELVSRLFYFAGEQPNAETSPLNQPGACGITPMHLACMLDNKTYIAILAAAGGNLSVVDSCGHTPTFYIQDADFRQSLLDFQDAGGWQVYMQNRQDNLVEVAVPVKFWDGWTRKTRHCIRLACCGALTHRTFPAQLTCPQCSAAIPLHPLMLINDQWPLDTRRQNNSCCGFLSAFAASKEQIPLQ